MTFSGIITATIDRVVISPITCFLPPASSSPVSPKSEEMKCVVPLIQQLTHAYAQKLPPLSHTAIPLQGRQSGSYIIVDGTTDLLVELMSFY